VSSRGNRAAAGPPLPSGHSPTDRTEDFERVFADVPVGVLVIAATGIIESANASFCRYSQYSELELIGSDVLDLVYPEDRDASAERFRSRSTGRDGDSGERRLRAKDGSERWGLATVVITDGGARVVFIRDMTDQRRMQLELEQQNERLLSADREKDELISVVSHELRTPLTSIMGYLELALAEDDDGALTDACRQYLLVAQRNSARLYRLVEDLLFVSSSSAGRATLNLVIVDIDEIVRGAVAAALPSAVAGEVELAVRGEAGGTILADAQRVTEVIENLLSNAVKFTPQHGRVDVEVSGDADAVSVCVLDTGQGIADDDASRLFDRFFRASDAEGLPGAGLGLSIAKTIVDAHGGSIGVESREGDGTSFEVRLPRAGPAVGAVA
jgi:PAS domain S-box-containing protein